MGNSYSLQYNICWDRDNVSVGAERSTVNRPERCCQASCSRVEQGRLDCRQFDWTRNHHQPVKADEYISDVVTGPHTVDADQVSQQANQISLLASPVPCVVLCDQ